MASIDSLMTSPPVTATAGEPLTAAIRRMHDHRVGSVVVMEGNRAIGIVTERDVLRAAAGGSGDTVGSVMTSPVETSDVATPLADALATMRERGYRHMPVTDHENPVGVVSLRDLMRVASIGPTDVPRGLKGVVVADTEVGDVRGSEGFYHYRQYSAVELAERCPLPTKIADASPRRCNHCAASRRRCSRCCSRSRQPVNRSMAFVPRSRWRRRRAVCDP
jgi:CBS domain-containing protein